MDFAELIAHLGEAGQERAVYSVEDRNMLDHETEKQYFLNEQEAIAVAEALWLSFDELTRGEREISVHRGNITYEANLNQPRFIVHQKLFKAYKKVYVAQSFAKAYLSQRKAFYMEAQGLDEQEATMQARKEFMACYDIQPVVAYGMFAGYDYRPEDMLKFQQQKNG